MLVTEKKTVTKEQVVVKDILCNVCGNSLNQGSGGPEGIVELELTSGYDSHLFGDMTHLKFSICEACLFGWSRTWKHSPIDREDDWWEFWDRGCTCRHPDENNGHGWFVDTTCGVHGNEAPGVTQLHCEPAPARKDNCCTCPGNLLDGVYYRTEQNPTCVQHGERQDARIRMLGC